MGLIYLWTGEGAGKSTSALGVALRSVGWDHKVVIIEFMKGQESGELRVKNRLGKNYEIYQFGRKEFVDLKNPAEEDKKLANEALEFAQKKLEEKPDLMILDEINIAASTGLIEKQKVIDLIDKAEEKTIIYMTGRHAPQEFIDRADFATEIKQIKHPSDKNIPAQKGIEY